MEGDRGKLFGNAIYAAVEIEIKPIKKMLARYLKRILDCIKYLDSRNLALSDRKEIWVYMSTNFGYFLYVNLKQKINTI